MGNAAIECHELTRCFGTRAAVDHISFEVTEAEVFGFLGPNGAGKSTTARMMTGFITPTSGSVFVNGIDVVKRPSSARRGMGVVPEEANVYADLSVRENVSLMAELHGVDRRTRNARSNDLLDRFELASRADQLGRELSKGLRQRLMLCMALVSEPKVLFLDEPTSGLDVASTHLIREYVAERNRSRGMTVFLTTHNMEEAQALCHRVAIIKSGRLAAIDSPTSLRARVGSRKSVEVKFRGPGPFLASFEPDLNGKDVTPLPDGFRVFTTEPGPLAQSIVGHASQAGIVIESIATLMPTLEDVFLAVTEGAFQ